MLKSGYVVSTDDQLMAVMHNKTPIQAWQDGDALHHGGQIESMTETAVKIDGQYFMRNACIFKIR